MLCVQLVPVTCTVTQWTWNHFKICYSHTGLASSSLSEDPGSKSIYSDVKLGILDYVLHFWLWICLCLLNILRFKGLQNSLLSRFDCTFIDHYLLACCLLYSGAISNIQRNKHCKRGALESGHTSPILHLGNDEKENGTCMKQCHLGLGQFSKDFHDGHSAVGMGGGCRFIFYAYNQEETRVSQCRNGISMCSTLTIHNCAVQLHFHWVLPDI